MALLTDPAAVAALERQLQEAEHDYDRIAADPVVELIEPGKAWVIDRQPRGFLVMVSPMLGCIDRDFAANGERKQEALQALSDAEILEMVEKQLEASELNLQLRIYRTAAGLRMLVESQPLRPDGELHLLLQRALDGDAIYAEVCSESKVFAMRTTGKPARLQKLEGALYAVCRYLGTVGTAGVDEQLSELIVAHDRLTRALEKDLTRGGQKDLPLA